MANKTTQTIYEMRSGVRRFLVLCIGVVIFVLFLVSADASVFTWIGGGASSVWKDPANWTPQEVPNAEDASAQFTTPSSGTVTLQGNISVDRLWFMPGAGSYTLELPAKTSLAIMGFGIGNTSSKTQTFSVSGGDLQFENSASSNEITFNTLNKGSVTFYDEANAGWGTFNNGSGYGATFFANHSNAWSATINNTGDGATIFGDISNAGSAVINNNSGVT
ncbi:MAG: hypothetical protein ABI443_08545, partial [Chthoniobacterales bacterium]